MPLPQNSKSPEVPKRDLKDYLNMGRTLSGNHLRTELKKSKDKPPMAKFSDFLSKTFWSWIYYYLQSRFGSSYPYPSYTYPDTGVYKLNPGSITEEETIMAICGDWATYTDQSSAIAEQMKSHDPDFTIHIGDTYYVGAPPEIKANFVEDGAPWVKGKKGSFALLGNHEMYAKGTAFFKYLLPVLGLKNNNGDFDGQKAGYFCLENDHWRVLGLDTGYHSIGLPLLEFTSWFTPDCRFDKTLVDWLTSVVKLGDPNDKRGLLILTHHQYITAFGEPEYQVPSQQLAEIIGKDRKVVWLWGHEHKFSIYEKAQVENGLTAYGRCIGHGGTPVELSAFKKSPKKHGFPKLVMKDDRPQYEVEGVAVGYNGYVLVKLKDNKLIIEYYDVKGYLIAENWVVDGLGNITGEMNVPANCKLKHEDDKQWSDATKA